jgi:hypothetical protein
MLTRLNKSNEHAQYHQERTSCLMSFQFVQPHQQQSKVVKILQPGEGVPIPRLYCFVLMPVISWLACRLSPGFRKR